jgi:hypothetical protein
MTTVNYPAGGNAKFALLLVFGGIPSLFHIGGHWPAAGDERTCCYGV